MAEAVTKKCSRCEQSKPLGAFYKHPNARYGRSHMCKKCTRIYNQERRAAKKEEQESPPINHCIGCGELWPLDHFRLIEGRSISDYCKACEKVRIARRALMRLEAFRNGEMVAAESKVCSVCNKELDNHFFKVDFTSDDLLAESCTPCFTSGIDEFLKSVELEGHRELQRYYDED